MEQSEGSPRVLIADEDTTTSEPVAATLRAHGYEVETVPDADAALERVARGGLDAVLLNARMPRSSGIDVTRSIRGLTGDFVPVVLLFAKSDQESRIAALQVGADAYIAKPIEQAELFGVMATAVRLRRAHVRAKAAREDLEALRTIDSVTNARSFFELHARLDAEFARAERANEPLACCLLDVDSLKTQNERGGRPLGDAVLRGVADLAKAAVRDSDVVGRYGGDELFVMLPATHFAGSLVVASRILRDVSGATFTAPDAPGTDASVTLSVGVALYPSRDVRTKEALLRALEAALLEAKRRGGNRLCVFQQAGFIYTPTGDSGR